MLSWERQGDLEFVTVHIDRYRDAIESIKTTLPCEERVCTTCDYDGRLSRWGLKTYETTDPDRHALVLCCPSCETHVDIPVTVKPSDPSTLE